MRALAVTNPNATSMSPRTRDVIVRALGSEGGMLFVADFAHPWRAQFNTDFSIHLLLFMTWVFWRETSKAIGTLAALGCLMGGLFTLPYLLVAIWRAKGDVRALLLGAHRTA